MSVNLSDLLPPKQHPQLSPEPCLELLPVPRIEGAIALFQVIPLASFYQVSPDPTPTLTILSLFLPDTGKTATFGPPAVRTKGRRALQSCHQNPAELS